MLSLQSFGVKGKKSVISFWEYALFCWFNQKIWVEPNQLVLTWLAKQTATATWRISAICHSIQSSALLYPSKCSSWVGLVEAKEKNYHVSRDGCSWESSLVLELSFHCRQKHWSIISHLPAMLESYRRETTEGLHSIPCTLFCLVLFVWLGWIDWLRNGLVGVEKGGRERDYYLTQTVKKPF